jgi:hypothetical protein
MKKILFLLITLLLVFSLVSCSIPKKVSVTTTIAETTIPITTEPINTTTTIIETTTTEVPSMAIFNIAGFNKLLLTFTSCLESNIAVEGGFTNGDFTCTAKPGMKFEVIFFEFKNNGNNQLETPGIGALFDKTKDIMKTDNGSEFPMWSTGWAHLDEEYNRRESTNDEIEKFIGSKAQLVNLSPGDSAKGSIVFEIPFESKPKSITVQINDSPYDIEVPEEFIIQDSNLQETAEITSSTTDYESTVKEIIKEYIEDTLEGKLTKFDLADDFSLLKISYNSKWSSKDIVKKEMFDVINIFSGSDYPDQYDIELTATGNISGDSYKSINSKETLLKLHNYEMDYPEWLEETFK